MLRVRTSAIPYSLAELSRAAPLVTWARRSRLINRLLHHRLLGLLALLSGLALGRRLGGARVVLGEQYLRIVGFLGLSFFGTGNRSGGHRQREDNGCNELTGHGSFFLSIVGAADNDASLIWILSAVIESHNCG